ncbi:MAG: hypothetical protein JO317_05800 [Verrucomicrobiae bacterium]|nr:hypothetical protein [Verrucomicrobiae bacterium]
MPTPTQSQTQSRERLEPYLEPKEKLLWAGAPKRGMIWSTSDWYLYPLHFAFFVVVLLGEILALQIPASTGWIAIFVPVLGLPVAVLGFYVAVGRFFLDARRRRFTTYGLTNSRVLILVGRDHPSLSSQSLSNLPGLSVQENADGSGTIYFVTPALGSLLAFLPRRLVGSPAYSLEAVPDARAVYLVIQRAQGEALKGDFLAAD